MSYKDVVTDLLRKSSLIAKNYFGNVDVSIKKGDNNQVLTKADLEIGSFLVSSLQRVFPNYNTIDEESGIHDKGSEYTWIIDPIDGTGNFAMGLPHYGIIVGLLENDVPIVGGVALPYFDEIYYAEKGKGATKNGEAIMISDKKELIRTLVAYGMDSHKDDPEFTDNEMKLVAGLVKGSQNLRASNSIYDAMMVTTGKYGGYLNQHMRIWDVVGPQVIITEAGGVVTDIQGNEIDYTDPIKKSSNHFTFLSSAKGLFPELLSIVKQNKP